MQSQAHILTLNKKDNKKGPKFEVGDHVRISKYKSIFPKSFCKKFLVFLYHLNQYLLLTTYISQDPQLNILVKKVNSTFKFQRFSVKKIYLSSSFLLSFALPKSKFSQYLPKTRENQELNFSRRVLFHMRTRVFLKYFVIYCRLVLFRLLSSNVTLKTCCHMANEKSYICTSKTPMTIKPDRVGTQDEEILRTKSPEPLTRWLHEGYQT